MGVKSSNLWILQSSTLWKHSAHAFLMLKTDEGYHYVVDLTFSQFLTDRASLSDSLKKEAYTLVQRGYFNIRVDRDFHLYRILVGATGMDAIRSLETDRNKLLNRKNEDWFDFHPTELVPFLKKCFHPTHLTNFTRWLSHYKHQQI